jgi:hypothetical protein
MRKEYPKERFNEKNATKAFELLTKSADFDLVKWTLLRRYAEVKQLFFSTDAGVLNRAIGKLEEIERVLELFGIPLYDGLPLADGTPADETVDPVELLSAKIGGGYPDGFGSRPSL